ncbi:MAG: TonB-dependent receptor [Cytophagaceae bacterium]|nr:TonB-dependent receptor [Cytophagaceae bacterium]MDW8456034.1 TonB-dependent receptor [Cytophagaceae bacterium]
MSNAQVDSTHTHGCNLSLSGIVTDGESGKALPGVIISIEGIEKKIITEKNGHFHTKGICGRVYKVRCTHAGYKPIEVSLTVQHHTVWNFVMHADTCEQESVIIKTPLRREIILQPKNIIAGDALLRSRGLSLGETVAQLPGVSVLQTGPTIFKPVVQGLYGQRVLLLNNGIRQESQQWGAEHAPETDPFLYSKITVIKGASSVRYGSDAIGGVILTDPKPMRDSVGMSGEASLATFSNNGMAAASAMIDYSPINTLTLRLQGSLRKAGNSATPHYVLDNTGLHEKNYSCALSWFPKKNKVEIFHSKFHTKVGIFSGSHIGNLSDLQRAIASDTPFVRSGFTYNIDRPYQLITHELSKISWQRNIKRAGALRIILARQYNDRREYDSHSYLSNSNDAELQLRISTYTGQLSFDHFLYKNFRGSIGIQAIQQANAYRGRFFIPNFKSLAAGIFATEQWQHNHLLLEAGIRYDYKWLQAFYYENNYLQHPQFTFQNISGMAGVAYELTDQLKVSVTTGSGFRTPHVSELFSNGVHHGAAAYEIGNKNLKPENALHTALAAQLYTKKLSSEVTLYHNHIDHYIYLSPRFPATLTIRGAFPTFEYTQVNASFTGADLWLQDSIAKRWVYSAKASVLRAYNHTDDAHLILTPPARHEHSVTFLMPETKKIKHPYLQISITHVLKKYNLPDSSDYAPAPDAYYLLNATAAMQWPVSKHNINIHFTVNNILNRAYRDYLDRFRYYMHAPGRNFIIRLNVFFNS